MIIKRIGGFLALATLCLLPQNIASAKDTIQSNFDATTVSMARDYAVLEVRQAIELCRIGKTDEAIPTLREYAKQGDIGATYVLGKLHARGIGITASTKEALKLFRANVENGHAPSMVALAELRQSTNPREAVYLLKQAAAKNEASAQAQLGVIYEGGELGVSKNLQLAFKYYEQASEADHPVGHYHLARFYDQGIEVSENEVLSTRLYRKAAMGGVASANAVMARRYFEGKGIETDPIAAVGWLTRGAQNGSTESMVLLGERYELGDAMRQDINRAGQLFSQAAKLGDAAGNFKLAMLYLNGVGTKADPVRAYVLLSNAQALPKGKAMFLELKKKLTPEQLSLAEKKISEQGRTGTLQK